MKLALEEKFGVKRDNDFLSRVLTVGELQEHTVALLAAESTLTNDWSRAQPRKLSNSSNKKAARQAGATRDELMKKLETKCFLIVP